MGNSLCQNLIIRSPCRVLPISFTTLFQNAENLLFSNIKMNRFISKTKLSYYVISSNLNRFFEKDDVPFSQDFFFSFKDYDGAKKKV